MRLEEARQKSEEPRRRVEPRLPYKRDGPQLFGASWNSHSNRLLAWRWAERQLNSGIVKPLVRRDVVPENANFLIDRIHGRATELSETAFLCLPTKDRPCLERSVDQGWVYG